MRLVLLALVMGTLLSPSQTQPTAQSTKLGASDATPPNGTTAKAELRLSDDGRVIGCTIIQSSGFKDLDRRACEILRKNAHFTSFKVKD
jgi:hypothetical protein